MFFLSSQIIELYIKQKQIYRFLLEFFSVYGLGLGIILT